jgi:RNA polymerase sigma-70 factor (ECF subfamily)
MKKLQLQKQQQPQLQPQLNFNTVYAEFSEPLYRFCLRKISDCELAKDLLQETFFRAWRHVSEGKEIMNMKAFLYKILGNLIIDQYRKRPSDESLDMMCEDGFDPGTDETERLIDSIDGVQAVRFLGEIREPYRTTIQMRYLEQLSIREIAGKSDAGENTVVVRIHRGLRILQKLVDRVGEVGEVAETNRVMAQ